MLAEPISVVVPAFNSERSLPLLVERIASVLPDICHKHELIIVDDASSDRSWDVIKELAKQYPWVRGYSLARNFGQHNALLAGIREARYEITVTMDDDLQHPPEKIPVLLTELNRGFDVVYGSPTKAAHSLLRSFASYLTKLSLRTAMGVEAAQQVSAFRAFRTRLRDGFCQYEGAFVSLDVLLTWSTQSFSAVKVEHAERQIGKSGYTVRRLMTHAVNMLTGFSAVPLQIASWVGFVFTLFGGGILIYVIGRYLIEGGSVPGFPFLASIIALFAGAQLFALGVIGEYLVRMHFRLLGRPTYVVASKTSFKNAGAAPGVQLNPAEQHSLKFHHVGVLVDKIETFLSQSFWVRLSDVVYDPIQKCRLCLAGLSDSETHLVELVEPVGPESRCWDALRKGQRQHHICFKVASKTLAEALMAKHRILPVTDWEPAVLFNARRVRFGYTRNRELVEFLTDES